MKFRIFLQNTPLGILIGFIVGMLLAWGLDAFDANDVRKLYVYVISAILSLVAATLTVVGVLTNIEHLNEVERSKRAKKLLSAKAMLPAALSKLCSICQYGLQHSYEISQDLSEEQKAELKKESFKNLELTPEIISVFRDILELSEDPIVTNRIEGVLREHQIFYARWQGEFRDDGNIMKQTQHHYFERSAMWAYLHAIALSIFSYARGESPSIEDHNSRDLILSSLNSGAGMLTHEPEMEEYIGLYSRTFDRRLVKN